MQEALLCTDLVGETVSHLVKDEKKEIQGLVRAVTLSKDQNRIYLLIESAEDGSMTDVLATDCKVIQ